MNVVGNYMVAANVLCPDIVQASLYKISATERKLVIDIPESVLSYEYKLLDDTETTIETGELSTTEHIFTGLIDEKTYTVSVKSVCAVNDSQNWFDAIEELPPYRINFITTSGYLRFDDINKQQYPKDIKIPFEFGVLNTGTTFLWNRQVSASNELNIWYSSNYLRLTKDLPEGGDLSLVLIPLYINQKYIFEAIESGTTTHFFVNGIEKGTPVNQADFGTTLPNIETRLMQGSQGVIYPFVIEGEEFNMTEGGGNTITGSNGTILEIVGVEGTDFEFILNV